MSDSKELDSLMNSINIVPNTDAKRIARIKYITKSSKKRSFSRYRTAAVVLTSFAALFTLYINFNDNIIHDPGDNLLGMAFQDIDGLIMSYSSFDFLDVNADGLSDIEKALYHLTAIPDSENITIDGFTLQPCYLSGMYIITSYNGTDTTVTIPNKLEGMEIIAIASDAFGNLTNLEQVIINEGIKCIFNNAFEGCGSLKDIFFLSDECLLNRYAFEGCSEGLTMYAPLKGNIHNFCRIKGINFIEEKND